jgi:hypothetical protein
VPRLSAFCYDGGMTRIAIRVSFIIFCFIAVLAGGGVPSVAAQNGAIEFGVRVRPASGIAEPARGMPFALLSKSFQDIQHEAEAAEPPPDMNPFIDKLTVTPELKAWMKRNHAVSLSSNDFTKSLKPDDVMGVPEFFNAYMQINASSKGIAFPTTKAKEKDKIKDPEKYKRLNQEYLDAIKKFVVTNPSSVDGMENELSDVDPTHAWNELLKHRAADIHRHTLDAADGRYLVTRAETNLNGEARLENVPPGTYWLSTLDVTATVGDMYLKWDLPVTVTSGATARLALTNSNALESAKPGP